jgi:hypothetical protein
MTVHHADCTANRLRSLELLAEVTDLAGNAVAAIA